MKKFLALILALMLVFSLATSVSAEVGSTNEAESVDYENPVVDIDENKASPSVGDLVRFVPMTIDVSTNKVIVRGYFINMNTNKAVGSFKNVKMNVYKDGSYLVGGSFGTIDDFTIEPLRMEYDGFSFSGSHNLNPGSYSCNDLFYCAVDCSFTSYSR